MRSLNNKIKIVVVMLVVFLIVKFSAKNIFLGNTPNIDPFIGDKLIHIPRTIADNFINTFQKANTAGTAGQKNGTVSDESLQKFDRMAVSQMTPVGKGVYAQEDKENNVVYIKMTTDVEWEERDMNIDGKIVKVRFPKETFK